MQSGNSENTIKWSKISDKMKPVHIWLGLGVVVFGFIHGWNSPRDVISFTTGSVTWFCLLILACTWPLRKRSPAQWFRTHQVLAVITILALIVHLAEVGGLHGFNAWNSLQILQDMGVDMQGDTPYLKDWMRQ